MIAYDEGRRTPYRAAKTAADARRMRAARSRNRAVVTILATVAVALVVVGPYLMLTSGVYKLNYQLVALSDKRAELRDEAVRLDDRIEQLRSRDRLAAIAQQLGMRDAQRYALVDVPQPERDRPHGLAFLPIANWLR
jgi:cell division protein FtsL